MIRLLAVVALMLPTAAVAHPGHGAGLVAGFIHPLSGVDHIATMIAVGSWAALKGGRALWLWPASFVAVMIAGAALGMTQVSLPHVEAMIIASVVVLGLMVALAANVATASGALIVGGFALFHGYAHGIELPEGASGAGTLVGLVLATGALHGLGILGVIAARAARLQPLARAAGLGCMVLGGVLAAQAI